MTAIGFAEMNAKGQLMIPASMKKYFSIGEKLILLKNDSGFILRIMQDQKDVEDLDFAVKTEDAWNRIEKKQTIKINYDDFLNQLVKW
jgi:hypothetical protein